MNKFILTILISMWLLLPIGSVSAVSTTGFNNLGGKILKIDFCTCSLGLMITVAKAPTFVPVNVLYVPFISRLNMNFNPFLLGNNVILQHTGVPVACEKYNVVSCYVDGMAAGTVTSFPFAGIGTSARPI